MGKIARRKGQLINYGGIPMKVAAVPDFDTLTLRTPEGDYLRVSLADIEAEQKGKVKPGIAVDLGRQEKVSAYVDAFRALLGADRKTAAIVRAAGAKLGISTSSAYAALARFQLSGKTADLPPPTRPGGRGQSRLRKKAEKIIQDCIDELVLGRRRCTPRKFFKETRGRLSKAGLEVSHQTLRSRLAGIPDYKWTKARKGHAETRRTHDPLQGDAPAVEQPLASVQVDHWKSDIEILSDDRLTIIGRAWITIAIDIFCRMIWGFHVGLDAPSTATVGMAMVSGMTCKDAAMRRHGLAIAYPIAGKPDEVRADNAQEFQGSSMQESCNHFAIKLTWRPIDSPQYGGHIERLNGTLAQRFKDLPGATGATSGERKLLRPDLTAAFTLEDLEKHLFLLLDEYHNEVHTGIGATPLEKYNGYFFGSEGLKRRLPDVYIDDMELRREWFPLERRTLQRYGIRIGFLDYYGECIEQIVRNRKDHAGKHKIRRNPYDVREIYLLHPVRKEWIVVPTRHVGFPIASIWELKAARREALKRKRGPTPELLAKIIDEQRAHIEQAQKKTKAAQRQNTRRSHHAKIRESVDHSREEGIEIEHPPAKPVAAIPVTPPFEKSSSLTSILAALSDDDIDRSFDD